MFRIWNRHLLEDKRSWIKTDDNFDWVIDGEESNGEITLLILKLLFIA